MQARPKVHSVAIEVTPHCQLRCAHCYNPNRVTQEPAHPRFTQQRIERLIASLDLGHTTITGGEPFTRPDIFDLLDTIHANGVRIQIISNGGLIDNAIAKRLLPYHIANIQISLQGPTDDLHNQEVGGALAGENPFERTLHGIHALLDANIPVSGCIVVTRRNATHTADTLARFASLGIRDVALSRFSPAGHAAVHVANLLPSTSDLLIAFRQAIAFASAEPSHGLRMSCTMPVPPCALEVEELAPIRFGSCAIGTSMQEFALGPDGRLRHCTLHRTALGGGRDILDPDVDIAAIVTGSEVAEYKHTIPEFCNDCSRARTCGGGCGAASEWVFGSRRLPDPVVWQHVDNKFAQTLEHQRALLYEGCTKELTP